MHYSIDVKKSFLTT